MPDFTRSQCMSKLHASLRVYHVRCSCCCRFTANKDTKFRITPAALLLSGPNAMQLQLFSTSRPRWPNPSKLVEPHTLVGGVSEPVCTIGGGVGGWGVGDVEQDTLSQAPCLWRPYPTHWYLQHSCLFVQPTAQGCGARHVVTSIYAFGDHAQNTGVFTAFLLLCTTYCARMWSKTRCHTHPCLWRPCPKHGYLQHFCFFVQHTAQGCGARHVVTSIYALATMPKTLVFTCSNRNIPNLQQLLRDF